MLFGQFGACERIKNTPIPFSYSLFIKKFIFIYVTTLPLAFAANFGYFSALIATYVFYVLVSMEVLAEEIEDPFGVDDNDLPTDELKWQNQSDCYRNIRGLKKARISSRLLFNMFRRIIVSKLFLTTFPFSNWMSTK